MKLKVLLVIVGLVQIILGLAYLFFPQAFLHWMGTHQRRPISTIHRACWPHAFSPTAWVCS